MRFALLALALAACTGEPTDTDAMDTDAVDTDAVDTDTDTDTDPDTDPVTWADDIRPWLAERCAPCHTANASGGLLFGEDGGYDVLVGIPSAQVPELDRITPGDPDASYLYLKCADRHREVGGTGQAMPRSGALQDGELARLEAWIEAGAGE